MSPESLITKIADRIPQIVADHVAATSAHEEMIAAEAALLDRLAAIVQPAVKAIGDRPLVCLTESDGENGCHPWSTSKRAPWRGISVASDAKPGPTRDKRGDANTGTYGSHDLFLCADGTWCELTYGGTWSNWQGSTSSWEASEKTLTSVQVARDYDVDEIVGRLCQVVTEAGSRAKATAKAKERAEKLTALVVLLGGNT